MRNWNQKNSRAAGRQGAFGMPDLLVVLAVLALLAVIILPILVNTKAKARQQRCISNLKEITKAVLLYANENKERLPMMDPAPLTGVWWWYKELVKGYAGLTGPSSTKDTLFACPNDRGYSDHGPFYKNSKFNYGSYVFNGVNVHDAPNLAGRTVSSVNEPDRTLLMMEWTAHAPLSWHKSRTGKNNHPFYNDAENVVGFVDGQVAFIKIYYDGHNAAYTRDPIPGYKYKYSGD